MIAKRILRGKAGKFGRLGEYIARERDTAPKAQGALALLEAVPAAKADEQAVWQRTADYILDAVGGGERVASVHITNCHATEIDMAIAEIEATQALNVRARGDKTYHLVVSFPPGERPSPEQLIDIEDELCGAIGLQKHQRISAVHTDTAHLHIHVAINQVHPQTHACIEPWQDRPKLMRTCARLEIKHGLQRTNHGEAIAIEEAPRLPMRAEAMEVHGGMTSLAGWVREEARLALLTAVEQGQGWQDLHAALAAHGLEIRPRGAGLIVAERGGRAAVKASSIDRRLSKGALEARWSAFTPPDPHTKLKSIKRYRRGPMHEGEEVEVLYESYLRRRTDALEARRAAKAQMEEMLSRRWEATQEWYEACKSNIRNNRAFWVTKKDSEYSKLELKAAHKFRERREFASAERAKFQGSHPLPTWQEFLRQEASNGNATALTVLRRHRNRYRKAISTIVTGDHTSEAKAVIAAEFRPETRANGDLVYRLRDGGRVVDTQDRIRVEKTSHIAIALALSLDAARGRQGKIAATDPHFARQAIEVAARDRLDVAFQDPEHERERLRLLALYERQDTEIAAGVFVDTQNAARTARPEIAPHRLWAESDAGEAIVEKLAPLDEGTHALLLRKGGEVLALPLTSTEANEVQKLAPGETVEVSQQKRVAKSGPQR
jgi:hypothetical protein